jgi:hypothetical protein
MPGIGTNRRRISQRIKQKDREEKRIIIFK